MRRRRRLWLALGLLGAGLLLASKAPAIVLAGIACLLAFVAWGLFLIAGSLLEEESLADARHAPASRDELTPPAAPRPPAS